MKKTSGLRSAMLTIFLLVIVSDSYSQSLLNKNISLQVNRQKLDNVLEIVSNTGNFFFSYNSNIINKDSLVSLSVSNKPVQEVLTLLLGSAYEFRESGNYIILRRAPIRLRLVTSSAVSEDKYYVLSGYVIDDQTGEKISDASIYEKQRLEITNTNSEGFFKLRLKSKYKSAAITVSKEYYEDTTVIIQPKYNQMLTITLVPSDITEHTIIISPITYQAPESIELEIPVNDSTRWLYTYIKRDSVLVEKTALGK
ncbi:MAG: STN and carboxypeptidase regulatory-like domain-containing protein, partial [Flavitalea sp.]